MKNRLIVLLAGLSLGVLAACGGVTQPEASASSVGEPAQLDPKTNTPFCYACPVAPGQVETQAVRTPHQDSVTGQYICNPCGTTCGDGVCDYPENSANCPSDCGGSTAYCGDGICNNGETCGSCSNDCGSCGPVCGDGLCNGGETCGSCSYDCGSCNPGPVCGDGICEYPETRTNCRVDCMPTCYYACP
jgi:hypothetical protein